MSPGYAAEVRAAAAGLPVTFAGAFEPGKFEEAYAAIDVLVGTVGGWRTPLVIHEAYGHAGR